MPRARKPKEQPQQSGPPPIDVVLANYKWRGLASAFHFYARKLNQTGQDDDRNTLDAMAKRIGDECAKGKRPDDEPVTYQLRPATLNLAMRAAEAFKTYDCAEEFARLTAELSRRNSAHERASEPDDDDGPSAREVYETALQAEAEGLRTPVESEQGDLVRSET